MVAFAHGLTNAVYRQEPDGTGAALQMLCQKYVSLDFKADEVRLILQAGIAATRETFAQAVSPVRQAGRVRLLAP